MASYRKPIIGVPASILEVGENQIPAHTSGKRIIDSLVTFADWIPWIIPARASLWMRRVLSMLSAAPSSALSLRVWARVCDL